MHPFALLLIIVICVICLTWHFFLRDRITRVRSRRRGLNAAIDDDARYARELARSINNKTLEDQFLIAEVNFMEFNGDTDNNTDSRGSINADVILEDAHAMAELITAQPNAETRFYAQRMDDFMTTYETDPQLQRALLASLADPHVTFHEDIAVFRAQEQKDAVRIVADNKRKSKNKKEVVHKSLEAAATYTDDRQNVHDTTVNRETSRALRRIIGGNGALSSHDKEEIFDEISAAITRELSEDEQAAARQTLTKMREGGAVTALDTTEDELLAHVWQRSHHPRNTTSRGNIQSMILRMLVDCVENGSLVCANGRCSRIVGSLATLDFDPECGASTTYESYRNQMYETTRRIFDDEVKRAENSGDADMVAVAKSYTDLSDPPEEALERFRGRVRKRVQDELYSDVYKSLTEPQRIKIMEACEVFINV
jgi:hypothetical protein